jgi:hypothetical protein
MRFEVDEAGFVRAPAWLAYRRLTDVAAWPTWWRGTRVRAVLGAEEERWLLEFASGLGRRLRLECQPHTWRHSVGFHLRLSGDLAGRAEFWLEPGHGGTVVHHVADCTTTRPDVRRVAEGYRRAIRIGLWGLKDALHLEMRAAAGLPVGGGRALAPPSD